jgi:rhodanese-related sulfurtransferase
MQSLYLGPILPPNEVRTIEREELRGKLASGGVKLVMCRPEREFQMTRIAGSIHFETRDEMLAALKPDDDVVLYCTNVDCLASQVVYRSLVEHGYTNVRRYAGGLVDWEQAGLPLEGTSVTSPHA